MVTDQFLTGLDNHELKVQVATTGARRIEDLMRIARSLEAVKEKETSRCTRRGHTQIRSQRRVKATSQKSPGLQTKL